jgi:hypothetical protein
MHEKENSLEDLHRLTKDKNDYVRWHTFYTLGKISIFKAIKAENEGDLRNELEKAIEYFQKSSVDYKKYNSARFCLPFYRSFYTLVFNDEAESEHEANKFLAEAKKAIGDSKKKELLFQAIENLSNALEEVRKLKGKGLGNIQSNLNTYRKYCDNATDLLSESEKDNPYAVELIRKGLPKIDLKIKGILKEIAENTKALYQESIGTSWEASGEQSYRLMEEASRNNDYYVITNNIIGTLDAFSSVLYNLPHAEREYILRLLWEAKNTDDLVLRSELMKIVAQKLTTFINIRGHAEDQDNKKILNIVLKILSTISDVLEIIGFLKIG